MNALEINKPKQVIIFNTEIHMTSTSMALYATMLTHMSFLNMMRYDEESNSSTVDYRKKYLETHKEPTRQWIH